MGIYDRDHYRQGDSGIQSPMPRTAITSIILINVAVYVAEVFLSRGGARGNNSVGDARQRREHHSDETLRAPEW